MNPVPESVPSNRRMPGFLRLSAAIFSASTLLGACGWFQAPTPMKIALNAVWDQKSEQLIILESRYETRKPEKPYWDGTAGHTGWETVLFTSRKTDFSDWQEVARWDNSDGEAEGGAAQATPLYWYRDESGPGRIFYAMHGRAVVRDLSGGRRYELSLPGPVQDRYFWNHVPSLKDGQPPDAISILPSPDGMLTAVYYQLGVLAGGFFGDMDFYKCIAIFDRQGHFLAAWDPYTDEGKILSRLRAMLRLDLPELEPNYDNPPPPAFQSKSPVASLASTYFIWGQDSRSLYVIGSYAEDRFAYLLTLNSGTNPGVAAAAVSEVPERAVSVPGRAVSDSGLLLSVERSRDELGARIYGHQLSDWLPFNHVPMVSLSTISYAY